MSKSVVLKHKFVSILIENLLDKLGRVVVLYEYVKNILNTGNTIKVRRDIGTVEITAHSKNILSALGKEIIGVLKYSLNTGFFRYV